MLESMPANAGEIAASAFIGIGTLGIIAKRVWDGWQETKKSFAANPSIVATLSPAWERAQTLRLVELLERLTLATERMAEFQEELHDRRTQAMQDQIALIFDKVSKPAQRRRAPAK